MPPPHEIPPEVSAKLEFLMYAVTAVAAVLGATLLRFAKPTVRGRLLLCFYRTRTVPSLSKTLIPALFSCGDDYDRMMTPARTRRKWNYLSCR